MKKEKKPKRFEELQPYFRRLISSPSSSLLFNLQVGHIGILQEYEKTNCPKGNPRLVRYGAIAFDGYSLKFLVV